MLDELAGARRYRGYRGAARADERALARMIAALSWLVARRADVAEIEINPLRVMHDGRVPALDALVIDRSAAQA
jgi:acetate---CoA ligase (ADP-forming)